MFFYEFAAKQIAIYRNLGYRGAYLGGAYDYKAIETILEIERSYGKDDWKKFCEEINFSRPGEYYIYGSDSASHDQKSGKTHRALAAKCRQSDLMYRLSRWTHKLVFTRGSLLGKWGAGICRNSKHPDQGPLPLRTAGAFEQSGFIQMQGLRRLFSSRHRFSVPGVAMCEEPAQRSLRRNS